MSKITATFIVLIATLMLPSLGIAQTAITVTRTETQINEAYRVTNPIRRNLSDVSVDLQPG